MNFLKAKGQKILEAPSNMTKKGNQMQLILEQHGFEVHGSTYTQNFFKLIHWKNFFEICNSWNTAYNMYTKYVFIYYLLPSKASGQQQAFHS